MTPAAAAAGGAWRQNWDKWAAWAMTAMAVA